MPVAPGAPPAYPGAGQGYPPVPPGFDAPSAVAPPPKRRKRRLVIAASVAVALVAAGGGAFAYTKLRNTPAGTGSSQAAVQQLLEDVAALDFEKVAEDFAPSEAALVQQLGYQLTSMATPADVDTADVSGQLDAFKDAIKLELNDLKLETTKVVDGVEEVAIAGGTLKVDGDMDKLAEAWEGFVQWAADLSGEQLPAEALEQMRTAITQADVDLPVTVDLSLLSKELDFAPFLVAVEENGKWYTSATMSVAQLAYRSNGGDVSQLGNVLSKDERTVYDTPDKAAVGLFEALDRFAGDGDSRALAGHLPVAEGRLLAVYGPLLPSPLLPDALQNVSVRGAEASVLSTDGDKALVSLDALQVEILEPGGPGEMTGWLQRNGNAWTIAGKLNARDGSGVVEIIIDAASNKEWKIDFNMVSGEPGDYDYRDITGSASLKVPSPAVLTGDIEATYVDDSGQEETLRGTLELDENCLSYEYEVDGQPMDDKVCDIGQLSTSMKNLTELGSLENALAMGAIKADGGWNATVAGSFVPWMAVAGAAIGTGAFTGFSSVEFSDLT
jgi:hypothetical protein